MSPLWQELQYVGSDSVRTFFRWIKTAFLLAYCKLLGYDVTIERIRRIEIKEDLSDPVGRGPEARRPPEEGL